MKYRTTAKAIREEYGKNRILSIGYCGMQNLLSFFSESAYTCGVYGWNFDIYEVHGIAICTGYRGMPAGLSYDWEKLSALEKDAEKIRADFKKPYKQAKAELEKMLFNFIDETREANK